MCRVVVDGRASTRGFGGTTHRQFDAGREDPGCLRGDIRDIQIESGGGIDGDDRAGDWGTDGDSGWRCGTVVAGCLGEGHGDVAGTWRSGGEGEPPEGDGATTTGTAIGRRHEGHA